MREKNRELEVHCKAPQVGRRGCLGKALSRDSQPRLCGGHKSPGCRGVSLKKGDLQKIIVPGVHSETEDFGD